MVQFIKKLAIDNPNLLNVAVQIEVHSSRNVLLMRKD